MDQRIFIRRRNKVDDSYYEKRVSTISKNKTTRRVQDQDEVQTSQNGSAMKRLMSMRRTNHQQLRQNNQTPNELEIEPIVTQLDYKGMIFNSHTANDTVAQDGEIHYSDQINITNVGPSSQLLGYDLPQSQSCQRSIIHQSFMGRRQLRDIKNKPPHQGIISQVNKKTSHIASSTAAVWNDFSQDLQLNPNNSSLLIVNDFDDQNSQETNILDKQNRSMVTSNTYRGGAKRIQLSKVVNQGNFIQFVPNIKGIMKQQLLDLFQARCKDLRINPSKEQMIKFFEIIQKNRANKERKLNLNDLGLGNQSVLELRKNYISNEGISNLSKALIQNSTIVHLDIGCNQISADGAIELFRNLRYQKSIVSLSLANTDCYKNKNKQILQLFILIRIGLKGAVALSELLQQNNLIQFLNLADNSISPEGLHYIISGARDNPHLVSLNLSQNDIGSGTNSFHQVLSLLAPSTQNPEKVACQSLEELNISSNSLTNKNIEDLAHLIKNCSRSMLQRLDLSQNKLSAKALLLIIQALRTNNKLKISHLFMDRTNLEMGSHQEQVNNFYNLLRVLTEYLRSNKTLQVLSLNHCSLSNEVMNAIGKGLQNNEKLEVLSVKQNQIYAEGLVELIEAFVSNENLKLKNLDLSSNKINDEGGKCMAQAIGKVLNLEQVSLRDNCLGIDSGDAFLFLVQQKKNLWKLHLEMNMIKYVTLLEIEKRAKKNKRNAKFHMNVPDFKQQISSLIENKDTTVKIEEIDRQIKHQTKVIREGQKYIIEEEDVVHDIMKQGQQDLRLYDHQIKKYQFRQDKLDEVISQLDQQYQTKEKEWQKKCQQEESLLERCKEYLSQQRKKVDDEKQVLKQKQNQRKMGDEELKLRTELDKANREADMMKMIVENYEKEIKRRQGVIEQADQKDALVQGSQAVSLMMGMKSLNQTIEGGKGDKIKELESNRVNGGAQKGKRKKSKGTASNKPKRKTSNNKIKMINNLTKPTIDSENVVKI